jgi:hypothetical protein
VRYRWPSRQRKELTSVRVAWGDEAISRDGCVRWERRLLLANRLDSECLSGEYHLNEKGIPSGAQVRYRGTTSCSVVPSTRNVTGKRAEMPHLSRTWNSFLMEILRKSVFPYLEFFRRMCANPAWRSGRRESVCTTKLNGLALTILIDLSGGQKQRVCGMWFRVRI